ncbi:MAG: NINE protein [Thermodesulfobacteriota bacterium]
MSRMINSGADMETETYRIVFKGEITDGHSVQNVKTALSGMYKNPATLESFFSGKVVVVKKNADLATCKKIQEAFQKAGAVCAIQKEQDLPAKKSAAPKPGKPKPAITEKEAAVAAVKPQSAPLPVQATVQAAVKGPDDIYCEACGRIAKKTAKTCPHCGLALKSPPAKSILLLLTFFTGGIGGHKFYLKQYVQGVLYLLFFWTFVPSLMAVVEFIRYVVRDEKSLREQYPATADRTAMAMLIGVGLVWVTAFSGIMAVFAIPGFVDYRNRAFVAAIDEELEKVKAAQDRYHEKYGKYTASLAALNMYITAPDIRVEIVAADKDCFRARGRHTTRDLESWIDCRGSGKDRTDAAAIPRADGLVEELPPDPTVLEGTRFSPPEGGFSIILPGKAVSTKQTLDTPVGPVDIFMYMVDKEDSACLVGYADYPDELMRQADYNVLMDGAVNGAMNNIKGIVKSEQDVSIRSHYGREIEFAFPASAKMPKGGNGKARFFIVGSRLYQIMKIGEDVLASPHTDPFLASFQLKTGDGT